MSLESEIRTRWTGKTALAALMVVDDVTTGAVTTRSPPYVVMQRLSSRQLTSTNSSDVEEIDLQFQIFHEDYSAASAIRDALVATSPVGFHNESFSINSNNLVLSMKKQNEKTFKNEETGTWVFEIHFTILLQKR